MFDVDLRQETRKEFAEYLGQDRAEEAEQEMEGCLKNCAPIVIAVDDIQFAYNIQCASLAFILLMRREDMKVLIKQMKQFGIM